MNRTALYRIMTILDELRGGSAVNCRSLAAILEVSAKSIQRDVDFMRDLLGLPIEYDAQRHRFVLREAVGDFFDVAKGATVRWKEAA